MFIDCSDLEIIVRAAKNLRVKRVNLTYAKRRLDEWRTTQLVSFERYLLDLAEEEK